MLLIRRAQMAALDRVRWRDCVERACTYARANFATGPDLLRTIERSLGAIPERLPNLGGRWLLVDTPTDLSLGERVVLLEPDEVTVPRGPSEQDPVRPTDATK